MDHRKRKQPQVPFFLPPERLAWALKGSQESPSPLQLQALSNQFSLLTTPSESASENEDSPGESSGPSSLCLLREQILCMVPVVKEQEKKRFHHPLLFDIILVLPSSAFHSSFLAEKAGALKAGGLQSAKPALET